MSQTKPERPDKETQISVKTAGSDAGRIRGFRRCRVADVVDRTLAERIGAPLSSCHGLVRTLQNRGLTCTRSSSAAASNPSKRMHQLAIEISRRDPLLQHLLQLMTALRNVTGETVIAGKRQANEVIYLEVVEGTHLIRYLEKPWIEEAAARLGDRKGGARAPSTSGRSRKLVGQLRLARRTDGTIVDGAVLVANIKEGRKRGYFKTEGENVSDVQAISMVCRLAGETLALAIARTDGKDAALGGRVRGGAAGLCGEGRSDPDVARLDAPPLDSVGRSSRAGRLRTAPARATTAKAGLKPVRCASAPNRGWPDHDSPNR